MTLRYRPLTLAILMCLLGSGALAQGLRLPGTSPTTLSSAAARAAQSGPQQADYIVAVVNSEPITRSDLQSRLVRIRAQAAQSGSALPPIDELARQVLERLIEEKSQIQLGTENGMKIEADAVDQAEQNVARQNQVDVAELHRRLSADGVSPVAFRAELRDQIMLSRIREREVDGRVRVTELDIDQYLRDTKANLSTAQLDIELAQVLVEVPENATADQVETLRKKAIGVLDRARAGEDFSALIKQFSDGLERKSGASMGLRSADRYPPLFLQATLALEKGAVTGPVRSPAGWHVLKLVDKRHPGLPPTTLTQTHARHILLRPGPQLTQAAAAERMNKWRQDVRAAKADFAKLAKEHSADGSAKDGGDLGWAAPGQFVPEFEEAMTRLAPGEISEPVVSRFGMHLIQVLERKETPLSTREQREYVRNIVREKKLEEAYTNWVQDVRGKAYVEFREPPL